jgi:YD repeat-containing protein
MDPLLDLFRGLFVGLEPGDLLTGPENSLGTQVWVYDASGNRIELTDPANQGGDPSTCTPKKTSNYWSKNQSSALSKASTKLISTRN